MRSSTLCIRALHKIFVTFIKRRISTEKKETTTMITTKKIFHTINVSIETDVELTSRSTVIYCTAKRR